VVELDERIDARGRELRPLNLDDARLRLAALRAAGVESLAVCLLNSYRNPAHEQTIATIARDLGFEFVSISSEVSATQRFVPRGLTTVLDAYLAPIMHGYLNELRRCLPDARLRLMTSSGALAGVGEFFAKDCVLSGPAGGAVGCSAVASAAGLTESIGFDMGGTSTDVCRTAGVLERRYESRIGDADRGGEIPILAPMLAIESVAAGGGSVCGFDGVMPTVGPRSAGADPGPACYGRGGPLCITDVNVYLGRIPAGRFPFPLDLDAVGRRLDERIAEIAARTGRRYSREELALGYVSIANAHMAAAIRRVTVQRGVDPRRHALVCFGGAGGQHACALARELGIERVLWPAYAGLLSAYGIGVAEVTKFAVRHVGCAWADVGAGEVERYFSRMLAELRAAMRSEGVPDNQVSLPRRLLELRYSGQEATLAIAEPTGGDWCAAFESEHQRIFGFLLPGQQVFVQTARMELTARRTSPERVAAAQSPTDVAATERGRAYFCDGPRDVAIVERHSLRVGDRLVGPAIMVEPHSTLVIEPGWRAEALGDGAIFLTDERAGAPPVSNESVDARQAPEAACDPVALELFNHRFAAAAEEMGTLLARTALSVNVKERLDFSCGLFDAQGDLIAHAQHIPVHLGAMDGCVKQLIARRRSLAGGAAFRAGQAFITNDPYAGGSHLPDVTVITPVMDDSGSDPRYFVASRAHHAEIGGVAPGSMPPAARKLGDEGVVIPLTELCIDALNGGGGPRQSAVDGPDGLELQLRNLFLAGPHPSRAVDENVGDVLAQLAANRRGAQLLKEMVARFGAQTVDAYVAHVQRAAEEKLRTALRRLPAGRREFVDYLDDGMPIAVAITLDGGAATIDFSGTGLVHAGNLNATPAIATSAVLYCFRCLIDEEMPLNAGMHRPLQIVLPTCILNPPTGADVGARPAVAGGNVETSQRIVDAILGALGVVAASQGTMNNLAFGNARFGYYETIGGGAGAGPDFDGASAVHTHMTNTRLTDPEVLEDRYPARLRRFAIRYGSGGVGRRRGGDGIIREIEFLEPVEVSLLTQRRTRPPYGLAGGQSGQCGRNVLLRGDGSCGELGPLATAMAAAGDVLLIETPGGGGWGSPEE
jgi:5-oxoprolinase (ATP-hydrolysing)